MYLMINAKLCDKFCEMTKIRDIYMKFSYRENISHSKISRNDDICAFFSSQNYVSSRLKNTLFLLCAHLRIVPCGGNYNYSDRLS
jgi:hypothetical protein